MVHYGIIFVLMNAGLVELRMLVFWLMSINTKKSRILAVMVRFSVRNLVVGKHDAVVIKEYGGKLVDQLRNQIRNDLGL